MRYKEIYISLFQIFFLITVWFWTQLWGLIFVVLSVVAPTFFLFLPLVFFFVCLLFAVAFLTLFERKVLAAMQLRRGPAFVGFFGLLQAFADGLKLILKEVILPRGSNKYLFFFSPIFAFFLSLCSWAFIPFGYRIAIFDADFGILFLLIISSLNVYAIVLAGWSSNSKYALLGSIRSAAQLISYELTLGFIILILVLCVGSLNLSEIVIFQRSIPFVIPFLPLFIIFFISALAETNRTPFDLPEAEAELVAGYNVEYSSMTFALFFLAEYCNIILMSSLISLLFFGGWQVTSLGFLPSAFFFGVKTGFFAFVFIWVRATFPRYRYNQLMQLGWRVFLPFTFTFFIFIFFLIIICL